MAESFTETGFNNLQAAIEERLQAIERVTGITKPEQTKPEAPTEVGPAFEFDGKNWKFTKPAFNLPPYGYKLAKEIAENHGDNTELLQELIERESSVIQEVV